MEDKEIKFEECMNKLNSIVDQISKETLSLDESIKLYEEGKKLIALMEEKLKEAEEKVESIIEINK